MSDQTALYWFTNDLRLKDNIALEQVARASEHIAFLYVLDPRWLKPTQYQHRLVGEHGLRFITQSLLDLDQQLYAIGHQLYILVGNPIDLIPAVVEQNAISLLGCNNQTGFFERQVWQKIKDRLDNHTLINKWNNHLFSPEQLNENKQAAQLQTTDFHHLLRSFTHFRKFIETQPIKPRQPISGQGHHFPQHLALKGIYKKAYDLQNYLDKDPNPTEAFIGGELDALCHLNKYFSTTSPSTYKQTRNALDGWGSSTKFSPYLAHGNLSPRQIWYMVETYEDIYTQSDDTYWIKFELLWREYFHWLAIDQGATLFSFKGLASSPPLTSFFPERFAKWCNGTTPYPLVNACMKQLNTTGYMSNRGRQIAASCLINELGIDWRYGAAYFQEQLIDYDVASNWGNWQYIAGVGVDPRGGRHFNIPKQTREYDPDGRFIAKWQGQADEQPLDSLDAAGWPIDMK